MNPPIRVTSEPTTGVGDIPRVSNLLENHIELFVLRLERMPKPFL